METKLVAIESIRISAKRRRGISQRRVEELRREIEWENDPHPVRLLALADGTFVVRDGRHRIEASKKAGCRFILAIIENIEKVTHRILRLARELLRRF